MLTNIEIGKFLSYVLRHDPAKVGITLDKNGYANVDALLRGINEIPKYKDELTMERLTTIVATDNKQRYSFNEDKTKIRAVQGHSFHVDVAKMATPPIVLYHGTSRSAYETIKKQGIKKMKRDFVHLSSNAETAESVGRRHAKSSNDVVVLAIDCKRMFADGYKFYVAENGVWLTDFVPRQFISKPMTPRH